MAIRTDGEGAMPGLSRLLMMLCAIAGAAGLVMSATWWVVQGGTATATLLGGAVLSCSLMGSSWLGMRRLEQWDQANRKRERRMGIAVASRSVEANGKLKSAFLLLVLVLLLVPVVAGAWTAMADRQPVPAVAMLVLLFLLLGPASLVLRVMLRPGSTLRMDATGIDHALYGRIPWREVLRISAASEFRRLIVPRQLRLSVREPERYLRNAPAPWRWLQRAFQHAPIDLVVPLNTLDRSAEFIEGAAYALHREHGDRPKERWELALEADLREFRRVQAELTAAAGDPERLAAPDNGLEEQAAGDDAAPSRTRTAP